MDRAEELCGLEATAELPEKAGDVFERIRVQEIVPPRARLSFDGVTRNASVFDRRSSPSEFFARKKGG